jgi:hypothetical protein
MILTSEVDIPTTRRFSMLFILVIEVSSLDKSLIINSKIFSRLKEFRIMIFPFVHPNIIIFLWGIK